jgi:HEAT repeat protein
VAEGSTVDLGAVEGPPEGVGELELVALLESEDAGKRRRALGALLQRKMTPRLAEAASQALADPSPGLRALALQVLERAPHIAPEGALERATRDSDPDIRARAVAALGRTGRLTALGVIEERLASDSEKSVVAAALTALAQMLQTGPRPFPPSSLKGVCAAVGSLPIAARLRHRLELGLIARVIREADLIAMLDDPQPRLRLGAAALAMERDSRGVFGALAARTTDAEPAVRDLAMDAALRSQRGKAPSSGLPAGFDVARFGRRTEDVSGRTRTEPVVDEGVRIPSRPRLPEGDQIAALLVALGSQDADLRSSAAGALRDIESDRLQDWAEGYLAVDEPGRPTQVAEFLLKGLDRTDLVPYLSATLLRLEEGTERELVAEALRPRQETWKLVDILQEDADAARRVKAVRLAARVDPQRAEPVVRALDDPHSTVRLAAVSSGSGSLPEAVAERLIQTILADTSARVRVAAVARFWEARPAQRIKAAEQALRSQDPAVREAAVEILIGGSEREMGLLARALHDRDAEVAGRAIAHLATVRAPQALALLWSSLRQVSREVGALILRALEDFDREAVLFLGRQALDSEDPPDRVLGLTVLAAFDSDTEILVASLDDPASEVRKEALANLLRHPDPQAVAAVGMRLRDPEAEVRALAIEVLRATEDDRVLAYFVDGAKDPSPEVRHAARDALLSHSVDAVAQLLLRAIRYPTHRRAAADLLMEMGEPVLDHLIGALPDAEPEVRRAIGEVLTGFDAGPRLVWKLSDRDPEERLRAVEGLGALGTTDAVAPLIGRLHDPDGRVRARSAAVLGDIGDPAAIDPLKRSFVNDPDMDVVAAIEPALRRLTAGDEDQ